MTPNTLKAKVHNDIPTQNPHIFSVHEIKVYIWDDFFFPTLKKTMKSGVTVLTTGTK